MTIKQITSSVFKLDFFFYGTEVWTEGLHLESLYQPFIVMGFFEIGSRELFSQSGLEPRSFWSLPPK
jgi:hypothetical protein